MLKIKAEAQPILLEVKGGTILVVVGEDQGEGTILVKDGGNWQCHHL